MSSKIAKYEKAMRDTLLTDPELTYWAYKTGIHPLDPTTTAFKRYASTMLGVLLIGRI